MQTIKTRPRTETAKGESAHAHEGKPHQVKLILAFAAIYLIWGSTALGVRIAIETIPPFCLSGTRFFVAGCLIYLWLRWRGVPRPIWQELLPAVMSGILLLALGSGANAFALKTMPSGLVTLLSATVPISLALLDWLRPRGNKPSAK